MLVDMKVEDIPTPYLRKAIREATRERRILAPLLRGWRSKAIAAGEAERLLYAKYRVTVVIPMGGRSRMQTRIMAGWQTIDYIRLHSGELAEFIISVNPVRSKPRKD